MTTPTSSQPDATAVWGDIRGCINTVVPALANVTIELDTDFSTLSVTSIEMITVIFEVEELYDIIIVDAGLDVFDTPAEFVDIVLMLLKRKEAA
ncbi:hypothetical protein [Primorskyibacter sp. 2E233]|uniref:hypothetical protein n=1 Tax=Primorskyibacter sp. 2E233 TaxID=3413431 RepID=UPI003BEFB5A1